MKKNLFKIILLVLATFLILYSIFYFSSQRSNDGGTSQAGGEASIPPIQSGATPEILAEIKNYEYTKTYSNSAYRFSFKHPQGFTVTTAQGSGGDSGSVPSSVEGETILLIQSADKKVGIQMIISQYGEDVDITAALVRAELPDIKVDDPQTVEVGPNRLGLAFMSDSNSFGGKSREVWFVWNKNLYQISTYAEYDELLRGLFGTWSFF
jgi:hypothetical protein